MGQPRVILLDSYFTTNSEYPFAMPFGMDSFDIYEAMYDREYKFVSRHARRVALFEANSVDAPFIEACFGGFPADGPLQPLAQDFIDVFDPVKLAPSADNWTRVIKEEFRLPLSFTMESLKRDHNGWSEPTLFVVDPTSPLDLIDLWNIRQFHPQILGVNLAWLREAKGFLAEFVERNYRPLPGNPHGVMIQPTIQFGRSIIPGDHEKRLERGQAILSEAGLSKLPSAPLVMKLWYDRIWTSDRDDFVIGPQRAQLSAATTDLELNISDEGGERSCRFMSLSPEFGSKYGGAHGCARWINVLNLSSYGTNDRLALTLPSSFNHESASRLRLSDATIISREGFVLPQQYKQHREYFRLITGQEALIDWLKHRGVQAEPSDPGRIAEQVLSSLNSFWGTRLLAHRETLKLLDEMAKSVRKHADGKVEEFPDRSIEVKRWSDLIKRRSSARHGYAVSLDEFVEANIFRLGLVLACTNCRKKNWFGIANLKEQLTCERCLKTYAFPQGSLNFHQTPWQYRVVGPYSVPNYAEGAYSTVLALSVFARRLKSHDIKLTYATGLDFKIGKDAPFEVDFTFWYQRSRMFGRDEEPSLVFGEAKSFALESFKQDDVSRMRKLADIFPGAFMVFATLKDELSAAEKAEIGQFALWGRERLPDGRSHTPVIVLTSIELFCTWNLKQTWRDFGGQQAMMVQSPTVQLENLWTLANLTQQIYLGLPDPNARPTSPPRVTPPGSAPE